MFRVHITDTYLSQPGVAASLADLFLALGDIGRPAPAPRVYDPLPGAEGVELLVRKLKEHGELTVDEACRLTGKSAKALGGVLGAYNRWEAMEQGKPRIAREERASGTVYWLAP